MGATTETFWLSTTGAPAWIKPGSSVWLFQVVPPVADPVPAGTQKVYVWLTWLLLGSVTVKVVDSALAVAMLVFHWKVRSYVLAPLMLVASVRPLVFQLNV